MNGFKRFQSDEYDPEEEGDIVFDPNVLENRLSLNFDHVEERQYEPELEVQLGEVLDEMIEDEELEDAADQMLAELDEQEEFDAMIADLLAEDN